ncbi:DUF4214 domain-containing protein [Humitalea sp. 24SJ18S-53]|uniref:DUF4214 domain-containing protein n=1 Tax=Humitalea sp. 24SJ18S-53 TaxID=3422307 RepID=UPI003D66BDA7
MRSAEEFVAAAYEALLGRGPDKSGLAHYVPAIASGQLDPADLLRILAGSGEAKSRFVPPAPPPGPSLPPASDALEQGRRDPLAALDQAIAALHAAGHLRPDQRAYAEVHRLRFAENAHAIASLLRDSSDWPACRVLEVGSSVTPLLYHQMLPGLRLHSLDLFDHAELDGIVDSQIRLDLEKTDVRGAATLPFADMHMVLFCEVLEHMVVNPANMFRALAAGLAPGGLLYVTTPNFYRRNVRRLIAAGQNPQPLYPEAYGPESRFHHHVREYTMAELLDAMRAAGLQVEVAWYSDCWDAPDPGLPVEERQNLVVVGRRG